MRQNESLLRNRGESKSAVIRKKEAERFLKQIRSESAYQLFLAKRTLDEVSTYMFTDLLNCSPDAPLETIRMKFDRLLSIAELVNDRDVLDFLRSCEARFEHLLVSSAIPAKDQKGEP